MPCGASTPTGCARLFICSAMFLFAAAIYSSRTAPSLLRPAWLTPPRGPLRAATPKQFRHYHRATGGGPQSSLPFAQAKQGPHDQLHGPVAHLGLWHVQWQPHGWHHRQAEARPGIRTFGEASMPPGSTATSPWRQPPFGGGAMGRMAPAADVADSMESQARVLTCSPGHSGEPQARTPTRIKADYCGDCDVRAATEVVCNGHGYVLAALLQHACGRHEHAPAGVADIDLCTPHGQRQPAQPSDARATPRYLRSTRAGLR